MRSSRQYVYKCFELRLQTTDVFEAEKWKISGFRVRVYDGEEYLGDMANYIYCDSFGEIDYEKIFKPS